MGLQPSCGGDEILVQLWLIDLVKQLTALEVIARITAGGGQCIRRKRDEVLQREAACNVLGMWIQPSIFMDDENSRQLRGHRSTCILAERPDEIAADVTISGR